MNQKVRPLRLLRFSSTKRAGLENKFTLDIHVGNCPSNPGSLPSMIKAGGNQPKYTNLKRNQFSKFKY